MIVCESKQGSESGSSLLSRSPRASVVAATERAQEARYGTCIGHPPDLKVPCHLHFHSASPPSQRRKSWRGMNCTSSSCSRSCQRSVSKEKGAMINGKD